MTINHNLSELYRHVNVYIETIGCPSECYSIPQKFVDCISVRALSSQRAKEVLAVNNLQFDLVIVPIVGELILSN